MNGDEKLIGERLATLEESVKNLKSYVSTEFNELKGMMNPKIDKVDALWEWREGHIREQDRRDRRLGRQIAIYSILITVVVSAVNIIIAIKF